MRKGLAHDEGRIAFHGEDETKDCAVKITNVKEKDNGAWKCTLTVCESGVCKTGEGSAHVTVVKAPSKVFFKDQEESTIVLTYPADKNKKVECVAEGGRPAASFSWMLGDEELKGEVVDVDPVVAEDGTSTQGQVLTYETKPEDNGKTLSCIVNHPGYGEDALIAKANTQDLSLDVKFPPIANNDVQEFYGLKIGEAETVRINFKSHPAPTEVHWEMYDGTKISGASESLDQRFKADDLVPGPSDGLFTAQLTITKVTEEDAASENKLIVTNSEGTTTYTYSLGLGEKPPTAPAVSDTEGVPSPKEAGSGTLVIIIILAFIVIVATVAVVIAKSRGMLCFAAPTNPEEDTEKAVEKDEGSDTESAEHNVGEKDENDAAKDEEGPLTTPVKGPSKKTVSARVTSLFSAMKKTVGSNKEKYAENESEVKLQENEEKKEVEEGENEKKDESIVYADLDKSAMSQGTIPTVTVENETTEYAEIKPQVQENKE